MGKKVACIRANLRDLGLPLRYTPSCAISVCRGDRYDDACIVVSTGKTCVSMLADIVTVRAPLRWVGKKGYYIFG